MARFQGAVFSVEFSLPTGARATASSDETVVLWNLADPARPTPRGAPLTGFGNPMAFSPDGRTLATGSKDGAVILWDVTDPARPTRRGPPLADHTSFVNSVAFSPDGRTLATVGSDDTVILWDLSRPNHLRDNGIQRACTITGRGLNRDEWTRYILGLPYQNTCPE